MLRTSGSERSGDRLAGKRLLLACLQTKSSLDHMRLPMLGGSATCNMYRLQGFPDTFAVAHAKKRLFSLKVRGARERENPETTRNQSSH